MSGYSRSYDIHDFGLRVETDDAALLDSAGLVLEPFAVQHRLDGDFLLRIEHGPAPSETVEPEEGMTLGRQTLPDGIELIYHEGADVQRVDLVGLAGYIIRLEQRQANIVVGDGAEWCMVRGCLVPMLCHLLARFGHYWVHSACLTTRVNEDDRAVMIAGQRGHGKTTTALTLAKAGMKMLADDVSFTVRRKDQDQLRVWGFLLDCKVHDKTRQMLPWLNAFDRYPAASEGESIIDVRTELGVAKPVELLPGAIIFLEGPNGGEHRLRPIDKADAVARLAKENVRAGGRNGTRQAAAAFGAMASLVSQSSTWSLSAGTNLDTLPQVVQTALEATSR